LQRRRERRKKGREKKERERGERREGKGDLSQQTILAVALTVCTLLTLH